MRSFISSFKTLTFERALIWLLSGILLYFAILEVAMRTVFPKISHGQYREQTDYRAATAVRSVADGGRKSVLVIGNSLLLQGIDRAKLQQMLAPAAAVTVFPIEGTTYFDWYYGLRRLFAEGARPATIVLCINSRQVISNGTNGERFARSLMRLRDLPAVAEAAKLDSMTVSSYFFANASAWLGGRSYLRNGLLQRWMPDADILVTHFTARDLAPFTASPMVVATALSRLEQFAALSQENGAEFIWLVPPTLNSADPAPAIKRAAAVHDLPVLIPYRPGSLPRSVFADGFHLNSQGAALFTAQAAPALREQLSASLHAGRTP